MQKEKYQFRGKGSLCRDFPTDGSLKKQYLSKVLHHYFEEGMDYRSISEILPVSFASVGYWIRNFAGEYKSKTEIMEAISHLDASSRKASKKAKDRTGTDSPKDTDSLEAELSRVKEVYPSQKFEQEF